MSGKNLSKLCILNEIKEKKDILFSAFSDKCTKQEKMKAWLAIHGKACGLGLIPAGKDFTYTRDTFWQNLKKNATKKIDNKKQTGSGGGVESKITDVDNAVLDIIGRETPSVVGLECPETWQDEPVLESINPTSSADTLMTHVSNSKTLPSTSCKQVNQPKPKRGNDMGEENNLRLKKLKLQVELLEKESYLKSLKILKLEKELGIPGSNFTKDLPIDGDTIYVTLGGSIQEH